MRDGGGSRVEPPKDVPTSDGSLGRNRFRFGALSHELITATRCLSDGWDFTRAGAGGLGRPASCRFRVASRANSFGVYRARARARGSFTPGKTRWNRLIKM